MKEYFIVGTYIHVVQSNGVKSSDARVNFQENTFFWNRKNELLSRIPSGAVAVYKTFDQAYSVAMNKAHISHFSIYLPPVYKVSIEESAPLNFVTETLTVEEKRAGDYFIQSRTMQIESAKAYTSVLKMLSGWMLFPETEHGANPLEEISLINPNMADPVSPRNI